MQTCFACVGQQNNLEEGSAYFYSDPFDDLMLGVLVLASQKGRAPDSLQKMQTHISGKWQCMKSIAVEALERDG